ncbi:MAG: fibronectin type III domain-containing protein, partial [Patescibacteria group bacterium]
MFFVLLFSFITMASVAQAAPPAMPTGLSATYNPTIASVSIYWTDNANDEMGFQLFRKFSTDTSWPTFYIKTFSAVTHSAPYSAQGDDLITQSGTYDYKLRAYNADGYSDFSNVASVTVGGGSSGPDNIKPTMPSNFTASAITPGQINLSWGASYDAVGVFGYKIFRCFGSSDGCTSFSQSASVGPINTSYIDTQIYSGMFYRYYILAYDQMNNNSDPTPIVSVSVLNDTTSPTAPANLIATALSSSQVSLSWGASY